MNTVKLKHIRSLNSLFSRNRVNEWLDCDFRSLDLMISVYRPNWLENNNYTYLDFLKYAYSLLLNQYQSEYIYKNEFLTRVLLKELGSSKTKVFSEFRVKSSVADLVFVNGSTKVFEIKTEYDSTKRLSKQLNDYQEFFNEIYVIVPKSKVDSYLLEYPNFGIVSFKKNEISIIQTPQKNNFPSVDAVMSVLHTSEYLRIVNLYYDKLPEMNSFNQFDICKELISKIPVKKLNQMVIKLIRHRAKNNYMNKSHFYYLNQLFLALDMSNDEKKSLIMKLKQKVKAKNVLSLSKI